MLILEAALNQSQYKSILLNNYDNNNNNNMFCELSLLPISKSTCLFVFF